MSSDNRAGLAFCTLSRRAGGLLLPAILLITLSMSAGCAKPTDGAGLFKSEGCVKCHVYKGTGIGIIDLTGVSGRRTAVWMKDQILRPKSHDPGSGMPSFGHLTDAETDAIIEYLRTP